jgi:hypothetical protein
MSIMSSPLYACDVICDMYHYHPRIFVHIYSSSKWASDDHIVWFVGFLFCSHCQVVVSIKVDLKLPLPQSFLNYITQQVCGGLLDIVMKQANLVCMLLIDSFIRILLSKTFSLYPFYSFHSFLPYFLPFLRSPILHNLNTHVPLSIIDLFT